MQVIAKTQAFILPVARHAARDCNTSGRHWKNLNRANNLKILYCLRLRMRELH